ncbi:PAS domain-containing sensor histidine kinase [Runella sp.]|uniref:PAS domain-containing sensor histidine kinase n=1 Tax=Runella sp. TaxID=1960881 RepID=UPI003D0A0B7B
MLSIEQKVGIELSHLRNSPDFIHLPDYARFLLAHHLNDFAAALLRISRETNVPLLKYFEALSEAEIVALSIQGTQRLLEKFSQNKIYDFIESSVNTWLTNQLPQIQSNEIVVEDISKVSFSRRKAFREFLPHYTSDISVYIQVMNEVDRFTVMLEEICYKTLFDLKQEKINEHHYFIDKINNTIPGITYVFDIKELKEIYSNHKREELLGYTEDDIKAMGNTILHLLIHPDDLPQILNHFQSFSAVADGEIKMIEYRIRAKNGMYQWQRGYETIFKRGNDGLPSQVIGIAIDISKEKEVSNQLERSEHQLREAQEIAGLGSFEWDFIGENSVFSPQLMKLFELDKATSLPLFLNYVHPSDQKKVKTALENAIQGDGLYESEYRYRKSGPEKVIWSRGLVQFENNKPIKMKGTIMDVTQRHDMVKRLERSEELHKQAQALTHLGNWSWYIPDNKITWSDEMYRIYGLEPQSEEITFERFLSLIHPDDRQNRQDEIQKALQTHIADDYIIRIVCEDGTTKVLQGRGEVLLDENQNPYKLVGTCQDITRQHLLNEQLKENEETFRQLIFNAPDAIIVIDEDSKILLWNPKAEAIFGWTSEEIIGQSLTQTVMPPKFREGHLKGIQRLHKTGESRVLNQTIEITAQKKNGEEFYIALSIARSFRAGEPVFISFIRDISKEKNAEFELEAQRKQLAQKNSELERSNQELLAFNYIASHDLQEPVRKIALFSGRVLENKDENISKDVRDYVKRIAGSAHHMQKLIEALLAFSRATSTEEVVQAVDLNRMLDEVTYLLQEKIEEKKATITVAPLPVIHFVPIQFQQLMENIITNALKYSREDVAPHIQIGSDIVHGEALLHEGANPQNQYHLISIADNGIGFDQQYSRKIFELFQRLHNKNEYSGIGIGLAICQKIVLNHRGFIKAQGKPGEGAKFEIYIPAKVKNDN